MKKLITLSLVLLLVLSLLACDTGKDTETTDSTEESTVAASDALSSSDAITTDEATLSDETEAVPNNRFLPEIFRGNDSGMYLCAEFSNEAYRPGETITGTLLLQNETGDACSFYLFAFIDMGIESYHPENDPTLSFTDVSGETIDFTSDEPLLLTLEKGEAVTVAFEVATEEGTFDPDCAFSFWGELRDGAVRKEAELLHLYAVPINRRGIQNEVNT